VQGIRTARGRILFLTFWALASYAVAWAEPRLPISLDGQISLAGSASGSSLEGSQSDPNSYVATGSLRLRLYDWEFPVSATYSDREKSFQQPFNRYGMTAQRKGIKLLVGWRSLNLSKYTSGSSTWLGGGVELSPKGFWLAGYYGRLQRAVKPDSTNPSAVAALERWGWGAGVGYRAGNRRIELTAASAWDKDAGDLDSLVRLPHPRKSTAASVVFKLPIFKKVKLSAETAVSLQTTNLNALPIDATEELPTGLIDALGLNQSTFLSTATDAGISYDDRLFGLKLGYLRVDPEYGTLAASYMRGDIERIHIVPRLRLRAAKIGISGSVGIERNNIDKARRLTTIRQVASATTDWAPSTWLGVFATLSNSSQDQEANRPEIADSMKQGYADVTGSLSPRLTLRESVRTHSISPSLDYGTFRASNDDNRSMDHTTQTLRIAYQLAWRRTGQSISCSYSRTRVHDATSDPTSATLSLACSSPILTEKVIGTLSLSRASVTTSAIRTANQGAELSFQVMPTREDRIQLSGAWHRTQTETANNGSSTNSRLSLNYSRRFQLI
jgi:hypothetical protein